MIESKKDSKPASEKGNETSSSHVVNCGNKFVQVLNDEKEKVVVDSSQQKNILTEENILEALDYSPGIIKKEYVNSEYSVSVDENLSDDSAIVLDEYTNITCNSDGSWRVKHIVKNLNYELIGNQYGSMFTFHGFEGNVNCAQNEYSDTYCVENGYLANDRNIIEKDRIYKMFVDSEKIIDTDPADYISDEF